MKTSKKNRFVIAVFLFIIPASILVVFLIYFMNNTKISLKREMQSKYPSVNVLRRLTYEFNEERFLMAADLDLQKIWRSNEIADAYWRVQNRAKLDYWRNIDDIRFPNNHRDTSVKYHPYCGDTFCYTCLYDRSLVEIVRVSRFYPNEIYHPERVRIHNECRMALLSDNGLMEIIKAFTPWFAVAGDEYLFLRASDQAAKWIEMELDFAPNASAYWARGEAHEMKENFPKALDDYQEAWKYDHAYTYLIAQARVYVKMNQPAKAAVEFCRAILDIDCRCDHSFMKYRCVFKYELVKSRLLACPPYINPSEIQTLDDVEKLLDEHRGKINSKDYLAAKEVLFWTLELEKQGKLYDKLVRFPDLGQ